MFASLVLQYLIQYATCATFVMACFDQGKTNEYVKASLKPNWMYIVQSPRFPDKYPPNTTCTWTFTAPPGYELLVALKHFQLEPSYECQYDHLQVSPTNHSIPGWRLYCSILSDNYIRTLRFQRKIHPVPSERMMLLFRSDGSSEFKGFQGEIRLVAPALTSNLTDDTKCVNYLNDTKGSLSSPKHPLPYPANMWCTWHISVPNGRKVHLKFTAFDLEEKKNIDGDCVDDLVEIREGVWGRKGGIILGRFCGERIPPVVVSPSSQMWFRFISDKDHINVHKGFYAEFQDSMWSPGPVVLPSFTCIWFVGLLVSSWFLN